MVPGLLQRMIAYMLSVHAGPSCCDPRAPWAQFASMSRSPALLRLGPASATSASLAMPKNQALRKFHVARHPCCSVALPIAPHWSVAQVFSGFLPDSPAACQSNAIVLCACSQAACDHFCLHEHDDSRELQRGVLATMLYHGWSRPLCFLLLASPFHAKHLRELRPWPMTVSLKRSVAAIPRNA